MNVISELARIKTPMALYEENYSLLTALAPGLRHIEGKVTSVVEGSLDLHLTVEACGRYTSTITLTHLFAIQSQLIPDPHMLVRLYHDAKVAEVLTYQHKPRFWSLYPCPSPWLAYLGEKRNVNRFLREWLQHCLAQGHVFPQGLTHLLGVSRGQD